MATLKTKIQLRRDTADNLKDVKLEVGEPGYATDTKKFVIGDGNTKFSELKDYGFTPDVSGFVTGPTNATNNAIAIFDETTGKKIKNSGSTIDSNGYITTPRLLVTANSNTLTIGAQNASFCHIYNSANIPFIFNQGLQVTGNKDLGTSQYDWKDLYLSGSIKKVKSTSDATTYTLSLPNKTGTIALTSDIPSLNGYVTGSGLTADTIILGNGNSAVKTSSKKITTTLGSDDTTVPTSKAVKTYADSFYWANIKTSTTSSTNTAPTFGSVGISDASSATATTKAQMKYDNTDEAIKFIFI